MEDNGTQIKRFERYLDKFRQLKERKITWELLQRELLLEFINVNSDRISDFPDNPMQQVTIVNVLFHGTMEHPAREFVARIVESFVSDLTRYGQAKGKDQDQAFLEKLLNNLISSEAILIKCIQGVIYVVASVIETCGQVIVNIYGHNSFEAYKDIVERHDLSSNFWRAIFEFYVKQQMVDAYESIVRKSKFTYSKTATTLSIHFYFDHVLDEVNTEMDLEEDIDDWTYVEKTVQEYEYKRLRKIVSEYLNEHKDILMDELSGSRDIGHIVDIICVDQAASQFKEKHLDEVQASLRWETGNPFSKEKLLEKHSFELLKEQILASAVGAAVAFATMLRDFISAINVFSSKDMDIIDIRDTEVIKSLVRTFDVDALERSLYYLLETYFFNSLKRKGLDKKDKIEVKVVRKRRVPRSKVEDLFDHGLTKIRKNRLWRDDPVRPKMLEFKSPTVTDLLERFKATLIEGELNQRIVKLWKTALPKVEFRVVINTKLVSRSTTNLKKGLSEILYKYGILAAGG